MRRRVLVARLDSMGDVLVSGPAVRAVARRASVVMLCGPRGVAAARLLPGVDEVIEWNAPWISDPAPSVDAESLDRLVRLVREARVDEAVILTSFHQSPLPLALLLRLAGVPRITGASVDFPGSLLDVRLRPGEDLPEELPEPERALAITAAAGYETADDGRLEVTGIPDMTPRLGVQPFIALHPGAAVPARQWPVEGFASTAALLVEAGHRVVITGSSGERDLAQAIMRSAPEALDLTGALDLPELAGVLAGADVLVVGNTGPAHLAAAVGTPIVSLFSPVVPAIKWKPYGVPLVLLGDQNAPCRDSRARECPIPGHPCLTRVTPEQVVAAVTALLTADSDSIERAAPTPPSKGEPREHLSVTPNRR